MLSLSIKSMVFLARDLGTQYDFLVLLSVTVQWVGKSLPHLTTDHALVLMSSFLSTRPDESKRVLGLGIWVLVGPAGCGFLGKQYSSSSM
jgi:hypothetical protein